MCSDLGEFGRGMPPYCVGHGRHCWVPPVDVDMTGTPCQEFSQQGLREGPQGKQMWVFLAWVAAVLASDAAVVIHENVPQFWVELLVQHLGVKYHIYSMLVDCNDFGFGLISRQRRYSILYHKLKTNVRHSPVAVYGMLRQKCRLLRAKTCPCMQHWPAQDCCFPLQRQPTRSSTPWPGH